MSTTTEFFAAHIVPRLTIGHPNNTPDGYAYGREYSVGTDGYVVELRLNTVYDLQTRTQAIYYAVLSPSDVLSKRLEDMDDSEMLALLNTSGDINGHYLGTGTIKKIAASRLCSKLVIKAAASTATVNLNPVGSVFDDVIIKKQ